MKPKPVNESEISLGNSQNNNSCDLVDRISDLPDSILGLILSRLPTTNAVATSILSKRWRFGWVTIHNLDFYYIFHNPDKYRMKFIQYVDRVLRLHDSKFLNKFSLDWETERVPSQVSSWISTVVAKNVNKLSLYLGYEEYGDRYFHKQDISLCFFNCVSLRYLNLDVRVFVPAATVFCLPKLERLHLGHVSFESEETFEKLINGCAVLDDLDISADEDDVQFTYKIFSASLTTLTCEFDCDLMCDLMLEAPSLEYLDLNGFMSRTLVPTNLSSLVEAEIRIKYQCPERVCNSTVEFVRALNCAEFLTLSVDVMLALGCATISLSTEFRRLVILEVEIDCCPWNSLRDFILNSDNLEHLTIHQELGDNIHDHSQWTTPVEVPKCLSNCLKKVCIEPYRGMEDEHGMILYMLKHGSVLEVMQVSCYLRDDERPVQLLQNIRKYAKKYSGCELILLD